MAFDRHLADTAKVVITWTGPDGAKANNIFYAKAPAGAVNTTSMENLLTAINSSMALTGTSWRNLMSNLWSLTEYQCNDNSGVTEDIVYLAGPGPGGNSNVPVSPGVSMVTKWPISSYYRGGKPRTYIAGVPVNFVDSSGGRNWSSLAISEWSSAMTAFQVACNLAVAGSGLWTLGTVAGSRHNVQLTPPVFYPYGPAGIQLRLCSQRRRNGKINT